MRSLSFLLLLIAAALAHAASDYAREKRWAAEITPGLVVGDAVYLAQKSGHKFVAIYTAATPAGAAVVTVHGMGLHPDWALIGALRSQLADAGYATLSTLRGSAQIEVARADHYFTGRESELVRQAKQFFDLRLK